MVYVSRRCARVSETTRGDLRILKEEILGHARLIVLRVPLCVGCEICQGICPRKAITVEKGVASKGRIQVRPRVSISGESCNFCGICGAICPTQAILSYVDGEKTASLIRNEAIPSILGEIHVDKTLCHDCNGECQTSCRPEAIKLRQDSSARFEPQVDKDLCLYCSSCEIACPKHAISVKRRYRGEILFSPDLCEQDCQLCVDLCPSSSLVFDKGKVLLDERSCVYCGACMEICPAGALKVEMTSAGHSRVRSSTWAMLLKHMTSMRVLNRELGKMGYSDLVVLACNQAADGQSQMPPRRVDDISHQSLDIKK